MRRISMFCVMALSFLMMGCNQHEGVLTPDENPSEDEVPQRAFEAVLEQGDAETKTFLNDDGTIVWTRNDHFGVFEDYPLAQSDYQIEGNPQNLPREKFVLKTPAVKENPDVNMGGWNVAFFPFDDSRTCNMVSEEGKNTFTVSSFTLPRNQKYKGWFAFNQEEFPMMAVTQGRVFNFRNLCGLLEFSITGQEGDELEYVVLQGNNGEILSGTFDVRMNSTDYVPELIPVGNTSENSISKSVMVKIEDGSNKRNLSAKPKTFTMVVPPMVFEKGFSLLIKVKRHIGEYAYERQYMKMSTDKRMEVKRSHRLIMPVFEFSQTPAIGYLTSFLYDENSASGLIFTTTEHNQAFLDKMHVAFDPETQQGMMFPADPAENTIPMKAFYGCSNLMEISLPDNYTIIEDRAFESCEYINELMLPKKLVSMGENVMAHSGIQRIFLPKTLKNMPKGAFDGCTVLGAVFVLDEISTNAFPLEITEIGERAFAGTHFWTLYQLSALENLTTIAKEAFRGSAVNQITFPASVTTVGDYAFADCLRMTYVEFLSENPPQAGLSIFGENLEAVPAFRIVVPDASLDTYKAAEGWRVYADRIIPHSQRPVE